MKNNKFVKTSALVLAPLALAMGVLVGVNKSQPVEDVKASSYSVNTVPTNLNLNDVDESDVRAYYTDLNSITSSSEKSGTNLLKNLKPILKRNQKYFSYGTGATTAVWQAYEIIDRDWVKSPASEITGYDSTHNTVTGYTYGTSNTKVGSNPYIHALYINRDVENQTRAWGNHNQNQWGINQEHVWPKSCGFNNETPAAGARGDLMHLWAGNGKVNGYHHSNYYYGYVDKTQSYDDAGTLTLDGVKCTNLSGNLKGLSKTKGGSYYVFEPQDSDKGDIARAIFYMAARYNYLSGSDSDGIDAGNPNLEIVNELNWAPGSSYTSTTTSKGQMGILQDLLEWNRLDPPDAWEIHRNNLLYRNFTSNRNPFIDFPEWAEYIWGKSTDGSYSSTSTGVANPTTNVLNGFSGGGAATVSDVVVNPSTLTLNLSGTTSSTLSATVNGTNNPSQSVTWSSSNSNIATVNSSGVVTAKATGSCTITATSNLDNTKSGSCNVTVQNQTIPVTGVELNKNSTTLEIGSSETLNETVLPATATNKEVTWSVINASPSGCVTVNNGVIQGVSEGTATVVVTTDDGNHTATCNVTVSASSGVVSSVVFTMGEDGAASHFDGDSADTYTETQSGVTLSISNAVKLYTGAKDAQGNGCLKLGTSGTAPSFNIDLSGISNLTQVILRVANYKANSDSQISINGGTATTITSKSNNGVYDDIVVNITNQTTLSVSFTARAMLNEVEFIFNVPTTKTLVGISLDTNDVQKSFELNETFNYTGLTVTAIYDDETDDDVLDFEVISPDMSTAGEKTVTVSYTEGEITETESYVITVEDSSSGTTDIDLMTFDFEDSGANRGSTSGNNYSTPNEYSENGIDIELNYMDSVLTGGPINGSANLLGRIARRTTNRPTAVIGPMDFSYYKVTEFTYRSKTNSSLTVSAYYSLNGTSWTSVETHTGGESVTKYTTDAINASRCSTFYLKIEISCSSTASSSRDTQIDDIIVKGEAIAPSTTYTLVTDISTLGTCDDIIFVGVNNNNYYQATTINSSAKDLECVSSTAPSSNLVSFEENATSFKVVREGNYLRFKDSSNGYIASVSSSSPQCAYQSENELTGDSLFAVSLANDGMVSSMVSQQTSHTYKYFKFHPTTSKERFTFYTQSNSYAVNFYIFKKTAQVNADTWASTFLSSTEGCNVSGWSTLAAQYNVLNDAAKSEIVSCEANKSENYCKRCQAMWHYEYFINHPNFISILSPFVEGRSVSSERGNLSLLTNLDSSDSVLIIVIVSLISTSGLVCCLLIKKRRNAHL